MIALPPFAGGDQDTLSVPAEEEDALGADGVAGTVVAVIVFEAVDVSESPLAFVATTVKL